MTFLPIKLLRERKEAKGQRPKPKSSPVGHFQNTLQCGWDGEGPVLPSKALGECPSHQSASTLRAHSQVPSLPWPSEYAVETHKGEGNYPNCLEGKLSIREGKQLAPGHTAGKWWCGIQAKDSLTLSPPGHPTPLSEL